MKNFLTYINAFQINFFTLSSLEVILFLYKAETLEIYTFMEAADESKRNNGKTILLEDVFKKASH
jgi:hypothetical protein